MKYLIILSMVLYSLSQVITAGPPTGVLIIESTYDGTSRDFNSYDIKKLIKVAGYDAVVNVNLNPSADLKRTKNANGYYTFTHKKDSRGNYTYLKLAIAQNCANNLYSNHEALAWAAFWGGKSMLFNNLSGLLAEFFTVDSGQKMKDCINSQAGEEYTNKAFEKFEQVYQEKTQIPAIYLNDSKTPYQNNYYYYFLENMCRERTDRKELSACDGLRNNGLKFLFEDSYVETPVQEKEFDYEAFWNSPDDD